MAVRYKLVSFWKVCVYYLAILIKSLKKYSLRHLKVSKMSSSTRGIKAFWPPCSLRCQHLRVCDCFLCPERSPSGCPHGPLSRALRSLLTDSSCPWVLLTHRIQNSSRQPHPQAPVHASIPLPGVFVSALITLWDIAHCHLHLCPVCLLPSEYKLVKGKDFCLLGSLCIPSTKKNAWHIHNRPSNIGWMSHHVLLL